MRNTRIITNSERQEPGFNNINQEEEEAANIITKNEELTVKLLVKSYHSIKSSTRRV